LLLPLPKHLLIDLQHDAMIGRSAIKFSYYKMQATDRLQAALTWSSANTVAECAEYWFLACEMNHWLKRLLIFQTHATRLNNIIDIF